MGYDMKLKTLYLSLGVLGLTAASASAALAADSSWYAGVDIGGTKAQGGVSALDQNFATDGGVSTKLDTKGWTTSLFGGYKFNKNFALEAKFADLGKYKLDGTVGAATEAAKAHPMAFCLSGVGTLPLGDQFSAYGSVGACRWNDRASVTRDGTSVVGHDKGTDLTYGVGVAYAVTENVDLRAGWNRYAKVLHNKQDVNAFTVGLAYNF